MKVLMICHGRRHKFPFHNELHELCGTSGLTLETIARVKLMTLDEDWRTDPHIIQDITQPMRHVPCKFDIVSNMYSPYFVFLNWRTCDVIVHTFYNIRNMLKMGGYAVFSIADEGVWKFMRRYRLLPLRIRREFKRDMYSDEPIPRDKYDFVRKYVHDKIATKICQCIREFRVVRGGEKERLFMRWNHSPNPLHDEHHLIVLQRVS